MKTGHGNAATQHRRLRIGRIIQRGIQKNAIEAPGIEADQKILCKRRGDRDPKPLPIVHLRIESGQKRGQLPEGCGGNDRAQTVAPGHLTMLWLRHLGQGPPFGFELTGQVDQPEAFGRRVDALGATQDKLCVEGALQEADLPRQLRLCQIHLFGRTADGADTQRFGQAKQSRETDGFIWHALGFAAENLTAESGEARDGGGPALRVDR